MAGLLRDLLDFEPSFIPISTNLFHVLYPLSKESVFRP